MYGMATVVEPRLVPGFCPRRIEHGVRPIILRVASRPDDVDHRWHVCRSRGRRAVRDLVLEQAVIASSEARAAKLGISPAGAEFLAQVGIVASCTVQCLRAMFLLARFALVALGMPVAFVGYLRLQGVLVGRPTGDELCRQLAIFAGIGTLLWLIATWQGMPKLVARAALGIALLGSFFLTAEGIRLFQSFMR